MTELSAHHVGITVSDLERAVSFYSETFDFDVTARFSVAGEAFETGVGVPGASADFVHLDAGECRIELVEYEALGTDRSGGTVADAGAKHVGLAVEDLDAFYEALPKDVETLSDPQTTATGTRILFLRDPEGNMVEVLEE